MEINSNEQSAGSVHKLEEPHFDDEVTVLSARPVVPLQRVRVREYFNKGLVLGLSLAGALLVGVAATIFVYSRLDRGGSLPVAETQPISSGEQPNSTIGDADSRESKEPAGGSSRLGQSAKRQNEDNSKATFPVNSPATDAKDQPVRREKRKAARQHGAESERERRNRRDSSSDDVLRIREIFEGSPKP